MNLAPRHTRVHLTIKLGDLKRGRPTCTTKPSLAQMTLASVMAITEPLCSYLLPVFQIFRVSILIF